MPNKGFLNLGLIDVIGQPVDEQAVRVGIFRFGESKEILRFKNLSFPPSNLLTVPAFPEETKKLYCRVITDRFRQRESGMFVLAKDEQITRNLNLFRRPVRWTAQFTPWDSLPVSLSNLKKKLSESPDLRLKGGANLGTFIGAVYDQVPDKTLMLAKATLLNLYFKLTDLKEPGNNQPWFSFVRRVLQIGEHHQAARRIKRQ